MSKRQCENCGRTQQQTDSESLCFVHWFPWNRGRHENFASLVPQCVVAWATDAAPPGRPWLISRKKKVWHQTSGVGSENMTREILRLQMGLKGENTMGLKAGGYLTAVIEPKCIVCLISLTALIGWFKPSKHLGKPGALPSGACWSHFFFLCKRQDDQGHQEGKFESKMCAFLRTPQWLSCRQDGGCWKPPWTSPLWLVTLRSP